jgi:hypothetical protein
VEIYRRGKNGNTLIDVRSIKRPDRLHAIESAFGKIDEDKAKASVFEYKTDGEARSFFLSYRKMDGTPLDAKRIEEYVNRASLFNGVKKGLDKHLAARASGGKAPNMGEFWQQAAAWYNEQEEKYPCACITNVRSFERAFKSYVKESYSSLIHKAVGNDSARKVSVPLEKLFLALWRTNDKPFVNRVHELYLEFISGTKELYDQSTGEVFKPEDFRYKDRTQQVSVATIWNYLKDVVNNTAVYASRNGNFDYVNSKRPKHHRKLGQYSLSKISMDDVAMSRKGLTGDVYKYISIDVVSGYWFRPAYLVGKPSLETVYETFRNMFCELMMLGLPMPGELEVEHHLMKEIKPFLEKMFPFVRWCNSPTEKRAEHGIRSLKYGTAKDAGHTKGRWYAKSEAYRSIRKKVSGDFVEPGYSIETLIADDLADIDTHNNELHPLQNTYPGKTRKQVFIESINPDLKPIEPWYLYRFIGNQTQTSIRNNDYCQVNGEGFELSDFQTLSRLKPNDTSVTAYWLPLETGSIEKVYLYQGDTYIGEASNRSALDYNECAIERTQEDGEKMLHQQKRLAKFDKFVKDHQSGIPQIVHQEAALSGEILSTPTEIVVAADAGETEDWENWEMPDCMQEDTRAIAILSM